MTIQGEYKLGLGLVDHGPVIRVGRTAAPLGAVLGHGAVRVMHAHNVELFVLQDLQIKRRQCCVVVTRADHGDPLRPAA
jgi:hypothetical protein